ncbi:MAG: GNAT family N-acetyltransferase [Microthrixaceae bacterium]
MSGPSVVALGDPGEPDATLETYHRVDAAAFGLAPNVAQRESKRPLVEPDRWYLVSLDGELCGGAGSFPAQLTLPGGVAIDVSAVSDVGVLPTHRRRGALRALMTRQLHDVVERGDAAAVLHASEGSIYRRFGYGPATRWRHVRVDTGRVRFRDDCPDPAGSCAVMERAAARDACVAVHDRVRLATAGGLSRSDAWWDVVLGDVESYIGGIPRQLALVHRDERGEADGYALYEVHEDWSSGQANHTLAVWELVGADVGVELALWRTLIEHDLIGAVAGAIAVDHALWDVVVDARQVGLDWEQDLLWMRVLDVAAVLGRRAYGTDGRLVIAVQDPLIPAVDGTYLLEVVEGDVRCERSDEAPELSVSVDDLGACSLGGGSFRRLLRAGRAVEHDPGAATLADAMFATDPLPWCWVRF